MPKGIYQRKVAKSEETKAKMSTSHLGLNTWSKGSKKSKSTKEKMQESANKRVDVLSEAGKLGAKKRWFGHMKVRRKKPSTSKWHVYPEGTTSLEKKRFTTKQYKIRKRNAVGSHTFGEWELLKRRYGYICPACGLGEPTIKLTEDHIIPLSRGGSNYIENIQPLCAKCNTRKYTKIIIYLSRGGEKV